MSNSTGSSTAFATCPEPGCVNGYLEDGDGDACPRCEGNGIVQVLTRAGKTPASSERASAVASEGDRVE